MMAKMPIIVFSIHKKGCGSERERGPLWRLNVLLPENFCLQIKKWQGFFIRLLMNNEPDDDVKFLKGL